MELFPRYTDKQKKKKRHGIKVYHICYFLDKTKGKSLQKETTEINQKLMQMVTHGE